MTKQEVYVVGFPSSGKTTFLAALWHMLNDQDNPCSLTLDRLTGNRAYLHSIAERWRECRVADRTPTASRQLIELELRDTGSGRTVRVHIPDLSGETFNDAITSRSFNKEDQEAIANSSGLLLFVSADRSVNGVRIDALGEEFIEDVGEADHSIAKPWAPELVQEQVRLVDFLQTIQTEAIGVKNIRLSIVVSAWDLVRQSEMTPQLWLDQELPLLGQFLRHNGKQFLIQIFGVSAQGAAYGKQMDEKFLELMPGERVSVTTESGTSNDLTIPLSWLLE